MRTYCFKSIVGTFCHIGGTKEELSQVINQGAGTSTPDKRRIVRRPFCPCTSTPTSTSSSIPSTKCHTCFAFGPNLHEDSRYIKTQIYKNMTDAHNQKIQVYNIQVARPLFQCCVLRTNHNNIGKFRSMYPVVNICEPSQKHPYFPRRKEQLTSSQCLAPAETNKNKCLLK